MADYVTVCNRIDTRLCQLKNEGHNKPKQHQQHRPATRSQATTAVPAPSAPPITTAVGTAPGPMDLFTTRRRITPEEKARRMAEGRSYHYG